MTIQDAAALVRVNEAKKDLMEDSSLTLWGKVKGLETINRAVQAQPQPKPWLTVRDIVHGAVGAGIGATVGSFVGNWLGVGDDAKKNLKLLGGGLGTILNMGGGMHKTSSDHTEAQERRDAVMWGFLKGARDHGLLDNPEYCSDGLKKVGYVAITPDVFTAPVRAAAGTSSGIAGSAGALGAHIIGEDDTDEDIQKMMLEKRMLQVEADRLLAQRRNRILQRVLRRRQTALSA